MPKSKRSPEEAAELASIADDLRDMFVERWGFGDPPPAYAAAYQRDLETVQWANKLGKS